MSVPPPATDAAPAADADRIGKQRDGRHYQTADKGDQPENAGGELWASVLDHDDHSEGNTEAADTLVTIA